MTQVDSVLENNNLVKTSSPDICGGGVDESDLETEPPSSDCDRPGGGDVTDILQKMHATNRANDGDARSQSGGSKSKSGSGTGSNHSDGVCAAAAGSETCAPDSPSSSSAGAHNPSHTTRYQIEEEDLDLWAVWGDLVKNWEVEYKRRPQYIKDLVLRGIPCHFRTIAWQLLSGATPETLHEKYAEYMRANSPHEKIIKRDISRTYPEHEFFKDNGRGQQSLFNVIKAYSIHDVEVGYCQGSAFIVGLLLLQMPEEEAFAVFLRVMEEYRMRELYKPAMTELGLCMFQLECLVQEQMPDLHMHFNNMGFDTSMYASSWFLTLFTTNLPLDLAYRIMDAFLSEGIEVVFRISVAILQLSRVDLLQLDMEGMLRYFQREVSLTFENDHELLMMTAYRVKLNSKKMKKLEKDYLAKRTKEQEEAIELRRLRTENRLLRQRIEYLEQESAALAGRLVKGQVNLAQEAEHCINISHDLHKLRDINSEAHRRLEDAYETIRELSSRTSDGVNETGIQVDDTSMIEHIHALQKDLIETNVREADNENTIRHLKQRLLELEMANKRLKETPPESCVALLQEELISVKMREAESNLGLKEMRQRLADLELQWAKYVQERCETRLHPPRDKSSSPVTAPNVASSTVAPASSSAESAPGPELAASAAESAQDATPPPTSSSKASPPPVVNSRFSWLEGVLPRGMTGSTSSCNGGGGSGDAAASRGDAEEAKELEDQLMGIRIREADTLVELKEMRQRVMELETQNHVCTNQLKRQDEELRRERDEKERLLVDGKKKEHMMKDEEARVVDAESKLKEQSVMDRLKESDYQETIADLKRKVAELELKRAEKLTRAQLGVRDGSVSSQASEENGGDEMMTRSYTDALSIGSMDINDIIADVTVRVPNDDTTSWNGSVDIHDTTLQKATQPVAEDSGEETVTSSGESSNPPLSARTAVAAAVGNH